MTIRLIKGADAIDRVKWQELLEASRYASPFQTPEYADIIRASKKYACEEYAAEADGKLQAVCVVTWQRKKGVKQWFPKRFIYGGPVIRDITPEALLEFLSFVEQDLKRSATHMEIKNYHDYSFCRDVLTRAGWEYHAYQSVEIDLKGRDLTGVIAGMKSNRRREIGYSEQEGAGVREITDEQDLRKLHNMLADFFREKKISLPGFDYFCALLNLSFAKIYGVYHQGRMIGGSVYLIQPGKTIYTLYYCRVKDCPRRIYPTHLAIKTAIEYGLAHNLETVDMLGVGRDDKLKGIKDYKKQFGDLVEYGSYFRVMRPGLYYLRKGAVRLLKVIRKGRGSSQEHSDL